MSKNEDATENLGALLGSVALPIEHPEQIVQLEIAETERDAANPHVVTVTRWRSSRRDIGFGVHVTEGVDGLFIHFRSPSGRAMGLCVDDSSDVPLLGKQTLHEWARGIIDGHDSLRPLE